LKKVLIFTYSTNQGGSELNAYKILKLSEHVNFDWVVLKESKSNLTLNILELDNLEQYLSINFSGFRSINSFKAFKKLLLIIRSNNYQTIYGVGFMPSLLVSILKLFFNYRLISTRRERMPWARFYHKPFIYFVNIMSDYIETNSKSINSELNTSLSSKNKSYFLPNIILKNNGIYLKVYKNNLKYIGNVANVRDEKNIDLFLKIAFRMIKKRSDVVFILSGKDSPSKKVTNFINNNNLHNRLIILENIDYSQIFSFYKSLDIFLFTSKFEGSPNVLFEAMSEAVPMVVSSISATEEVILDGVSGFLCNLDDEKKFIEKIELLLDDEFIHKTMKDNIKRQYIEYASTNDPLKQINTKIIWDYD
jgi:glycosyltransferase involved in cell wall biosynthesis